MFIPHQDTPVKVLHLITRLIVGGAQENTMYTAALLDKRKFMVEVLSGPQTGSEGSLIEEVQAQGIPLTILPNLLRQVSLFNDLHSLWWMTRFIRRHGFQIVHTHSSKAGILGRLAARLAGVPIIIHTVHGWSFHEYMSSLARMTYIFLEKWMASFTNALIVVSRKDIEKGLHAGIGTPDRYHLIRSAIPLDLFKPSTIERQTIRKELGISKNAIVVGNIGRFSHQKNPLDWVRVAGFLGREFPEARFLLVGDGPLKSKVEKLLVQEGIYEKTIMPGLRRDAGRLMSAMDIFMLTSLWEGLPRVIPQAMAMMLPIVANSIDGVSEIVMDGEAGFLCIPGDIPTMVERCSELIKDPIRRNEMGQKGRTFIIEEFDIQKMIAQIEALYERLLLN